MRKVCSFLLAIALICGLWVSAGAEKATLEAGSYTVGSDLPAGDYEITCTKISNFYTDYMDSMQSLAGDDPELNALFGLYGSLTDTMEATVKIKGPYGENKGSFSLKEGGKKKVTLGDGWTIEMDEGVFEFELLKAAAPAETEETSTTKATSEAGQTAKVELNLDLSQYSDDEILAIYSLVGQEIVSRRINKTAKVPGGSYVAGVDLPAGKYTLETIDDSWGTSVYIYTDSTKNLKLDEAYVKAGQSYTLNLEDGNMFVTDKDVVLTIYTGISFN